MNASNLALGPGLLLEPLRASHAHDMFAVLADPAIYEFENAPPPSEAWLHERYQRLQLRGPADGSELWLNWVIRLDTRELAGYVQATVMPDGLAFIAYELNSRFWRRGIGGRAVGAMLATLGRDYGVREFVAVLKAANFRSKGLLLKLGFVQADELLSLRWRDESDEVVFVKPWAGVADAAPAQA